jgi:hypothetical protein
MAIVKAGDQVEGISRKSMPAQKTWPPRLSKGFVATDPFGVLRNGSGRFQVVRASLLGRHW